MGQRAGWEHRIEKQAPRAGLEKDRHTPSPSLGFRPSKSEGDVDAVRRLGTLPDVRKFDLTGRAPVLQKEARPLCEYSGSRRMLVHQQHSLFWRDGSIRWLRVASHPALPVGESHRLAELEDFRSRRRGGRAVEDGLACRCLIGRDDTGLIGPVIGKTGKARQSASQLKYVNLYDPEKLMNLVKNRDSDGFRYTFGSKTSYNPRLKYYGGEGTRFASESSVLSKLLVVDHHWLGNAL